MAWWSFSQNLDSGLAFMYPTEKKKQNFSFDGRTQPDPAKGWLSSWGSNIQLCKRNQTALRCTDCMWHFWFFICTGIQVPKVILTSDPIHQTSTVKGSEQNNMHTLRCKYIRYLYCFVIVWSGPDMTNICRSARNTSRFWKSHFSCHFLKIS